jgi:hypothetical protein
MNGKGTLSYPDGSTYEGGKFETLMLWRSIAYQCIALHCATLHCIASQHSVASLHITASLHSEALNINALRCITA